MSQVTLGIDVSKDTVDVALLEGDNARFHQVPNSPAGYAQLGKWLHRAQGKGIHACLEATGQYGDGIATHLFKQGYAVNVVNPARIKAYAASKLRRFKSDKGDAELIAVYCQRESPALWTPPEESVRELQYLVRHLDDLKKMHQQERNRLQSGASSVRVRNDLAAHIAFLDEQIKSLTRDIQHHIDQHPDLKQQKELLKSIPGIGELTAAVLLGEIRDIRSFESARQLAAYAGLVPEQRVSGSSVRHKTRLTKNGNAHLRKALYMPAVVAQRWNPLMRDLSERMQATGHCVMQIIGAIMRKLLHLAYGVIKTGKPFDPQHAQSAYA
ncbi:MAG: IS110 family transposase [Anaerolineae bacterium]